MLEFQQSLAGPPCTCGNSLAKQFAISDNLPENIWCQGIVDCEDMPMHLTEFVVPLTLLAVVPSVNGTSDADQGTSAERACKTLA